MQTVFKAYLRFMGLLISLGLAYAIGLDGIWPVLWGAAHTAVSFTCGWAAVWKCVGEICTHFPWWIFLISTDN